MEHVGNKKTNDKGTECISLVQEASQPKTKLSNIYYNEMSSRVFTIINALSLIEYIVWVGHYFLAFQLEVPLNSELRKN
ncbi:hypothetical protein RI543_002763 [Arxiozyma heterogenica]|uniref:Uncharacterized protein n=1 Tax=Arxiozyma heterogenica TaxID=278026 RepID=A0AAN7WHC6_9SACH|nr:hypothetical protein RI543_002763 [Kazachstania heterogenica]